jgi:hypothetical protein
MLRRVALVITDVSEERSASVIWVTRICKLGATYHKLATEGPCEVALVTASNIGYHKRRNIRLYISTHFNYIHESKINAIS